MKRFKNFIFPAIVIAGIAAIVRPAHTTATSAEYSFAGEPEIVAATFSSAWCSACKILEPRLSKVIPDFADAPVKFVEFDFTFGQREEIAAQAEAEGLGEIYPELKGATGFTLLVDVDSGAIIDTLTINHSKGAMRAAVAQAIAIAARDSSAQNTED